MLDLTVYDKIMSNSSQPAMGNGFQNNWHDFK